MATRPPTPQGISALLRKSGFTRSTYGDKGVMWTDASPGYSVWKTYRSGHPEQSYVAVQHVVRNDGRDWLERKEEMRLRLEEYAAALRRNGFAALVRDRGEEPPWLTILTVTTREATS